MAKKRKIVDPIQMEATWNRWYEDMKLLLEEAGPSEAARIINEAHKGDDPLSPGAIGNYINKPEPRRIPKFTTMKKIIGSLREKVTIYEE